MEKLALTLLLSILSLSVFAKRTSICSETDSRIQLTSAPIARLSAKEQFSGCTGTLIGNGCAITAGHCIDNLYKGEFLVPNSDDFKPLKADPENTFYIDQNSIELNEGGRGNDWAVFKFKENVLTGKLPEDIFGYLEIEEYEPKINRDELIISGYGRHWDDGALSSTLLSAMGFGDYIGYSEEGRTLLNHYIDTTPGSSGATVIRKETGHIIGIHGQGGCGSTPIWNSATLIKGHNKLKAAILNCLKK